MANPTPKMVKRALQILATSLILPRLVVATNHTRNLSLVLNKVLGMFVMVEGTLTRLEVGTVHTVTTLLLKEPLGVVFL